MTEASLRFLLKLFSYNMLWYCARDQGESNYATFANMIISTTLQFQKILFIILCTYKFTCLLRRDRRDNAINF